MTKDYYAMQDTHEWFCIFYRAGMSDEQAEHMAINLQLRLNEDLGWFYPNG